MVNRPMYIQKLISWKDKDLVKVITGIRRCGKSTVFYLFQEYLKQNGVFDNQIQNINLEEAQNNTLLDWKVLHSHIEKNLVADKMNYIFLDELQQVHDAQRMLASLRLIKNVDIYVTGSNAYMLSAKDATFIAGRYIEINMLPLSFAEYVSAQNEDIPLDKMFQDYLDNTSFPQVLEFQGNKQLIQDYIEGIYHTIVQKDIAFREGMKDTTRLDSIAHFMFSNIGSETSIKNISNTMTTDGRKIHSQTVEGYVNGLLDSYILYKANRYDIKGKQYLLTNAKYYLADTGLRSVLLGQTGADAGHILENIIYLELLRRGYKVYVGKIGKIETDFVAIKPGADIQYFQVSQSVLDENVLKRELAPLRAINDNYPKILLTRDYNNTSYDGIRQYNALQWLLGKEV